MRKMRKKKEMTKMMKAKSRSSISDDVINILCLGTRFSDNFQDNKFFFKKTQLEKKTKIKPLLLNLIIN